MTSNADLHTLAAYCGILNEYIDSWGNRHLTSDSTYVALLTAMDVPVQDCDPALILRDLENADWLRLLPPVTVVRCNEPIHIMFTMPIALSNQQLNWTLRLESGQLVQGECLPENLPVLEKRMVIDTEYVKHQLQLPAIADYGYHNLIITRFDGSQEQMPLIVVPLTCYQPKAIQDAGRIWGPAVQLYGLRSQRNWGIGDFTDLRHVVDITAKADAGIVGLNALHELFPDNPKLINPYRPSSRSAFNTLYIDVESLVEYSECSATQTLVATPEFQARLRSLRAEELVNYSLVAAAKHEVLDLLYLHFRENHLALHSAHAEAFGQYCEESGAALESVARFEALQANFRAQDATSWGWPTWPDAFHDPNGSAVADFAEAHEPEVTYYKWLQFCAEIQLGEADRQSKNLGLAVGLYTDLAVGFNPDGAEAWRWQSVIATKACTGAPPDLINCLGQDWGLPPFIPSRLREVAYQPLIEMLKANMRHAGAIRIDHAMSLVRLFWVPAGQTVNDGAYVIYSFDDLLGILALESWRNQCLVIGEVLGTIPDDLEPKLQATNMLTYHPFIFERNAEGGFAIPDAYPRQAAVAVSTHDQPTLSGFWTGSDLDLRAQLKLFSSRELQERFIIERSQDRALMLLALAHEDLLPEGKKVNPVSIVELTTAYVTAIHTYLARTPSPVLLIQPEDLFGIMEQTNLPGTVENQYPNWSRRLPLGIEDWPKDERFLQVTEAIRRERGNPILQTESAPVRKAVIPRATYRLQLNKDFTFAQATEVLPYLAKLGISHCYTSPYLKARPGSSHGYDVVNHAELNPEIGTINDYEYFVKVLHEHGMGQIMDIVPNHMGVMGEDNAWWLDVLENGPAAVHASYFDIDWDPLNPDIKGKILLPLLGFHYASVLERGEIQLQFDAKRGEFSLFYFQHRMPIDPGTYPTIVSYRYERLAAVLGENDECQIELQTLLTAFAHLPQRLDTDPSHAAERQRDKEVHKHRLAKLTASSPDIANHIKENITAFNGQADDPSSFDMLHALIQEQGYRLAYWRVAAHEINYRRFFDINDLAALRIEEPAVLEATHNFVFDLVKQGKVDGLRVDHPDGLHDPGEYFSQLQKRLEGPNPATNHTLPIYLVIEKVLAEYEHLPANWLIHGSTGYQFANLANNLFVDLSAKRQMTGIYESFIREQINFKQLVYKSKQVVMESVLSSELNVLAYRLARIAAMDRHTYDFTLYSLHKALAEVVACFPVYRTYVNEHGPTDDDRHHIEWAVAVATKHNPGIDSEIFSFIQSVLSTDIAQGRADNYREAVISFSMKFQQFSSPVMAKGLEDTSFYRYHRLVSLNDVGGDPSKFGISVAAYHAATRTRAKSWPNSLLATSTHDSKHSEDFRSRSNVLSEMPTEWKQLLKRWSHINQPHKRLVEGALAPSANDEYLLYQTLIGSWPLENKTNIDLDDYLQRINAYMIKAIREAKEHSSWVNINVDYEAALTDFIAHLLTHEDKNEFLRDFKEATRIIIHHGLLNSLSLLLLKLTTSGVPDIYQGCELWQFNLVDPDNRRCINYALRSNLLTELMELEFASAAGLSDKLRHMLTNLIDGRVKIYVIWRTLELRKQYSEHFCEGNYQALSVRGQYSNHICAFARCYGGMVFLTVVPRLMVKLLKTQSGSQNLPLGHGIWLDTVILLPKSFKHLSWYNIFTTEIQPCGSHLFVAKILNIFPVGLLVAK